MNQTMAKRHLLGDEAVDQISYLCVNPYDVNPLSRSADLSLTKLINDLPLKVESSPLLQNPTAINGGGFYGPQRKVKLEMEEFGDLSPFVSQKRITSNSIDELNTPVFDKDAFDFDISNYQTNVQADLHVMLKYDAFYRGNSAFNNTINNREDNFLNSENLHRNAISTNHQQRSDVNVYSPSASDNGTYIDKTSPNTPTMFDLDINSSVSVNCSSRNSSYPSSPANLCQSIPPQSPEDSKRFSFLSSSSSKPRLSLDVSLESPDNFLDINTPSIIAEVVSLESTGFNILDVINDDNIVLASNDELPTISTSHQPPSKTLTNLTKAAVKPRRRLKVENDDDDDDYVPPSKLYRRPAIASNKSLDYSDSESEEERPARRKARGRPPKRAESISSDCSKDSDVSKYRELRDKNNEASRKSRLKRKIKEIELEKESDDLHSKNIKLKAQVEELEKMVTNFRDNLFKIMINK